MKGVIASGHKFTMARLADYFVIVGYDREKERGGVSTGMILQRFPEKNWPDTPFIEGIEWFCQPLGWALSRSRQEPRFFVAVLTDVDANRHYCACLCFNETIEITPTKPADEEEDPGESGRPPAIAHHSIMYAPKCLVLVSRLDHIETFRNCLGIMYTVYVENIGVPLETLVGNVLGCIQVPGPGGPQVRFSIGAGDRQALQPPSGASLPVTYSSVFMLFQLMGIQNVVTLWCGVMTEQRVLFRSRAFSRLSDACRALTALMFPFRYAHVYIPLLPAALTEVLCTPTPFVMGVHASLQEEVEDLMDVMVADLDGGALTVPGGTPLPRPSSPLMDRALAALRACLQPVLTVADRAFPPPNGAPHTNALDPAALDKHIRAIFMRLFAQLLQGYRSCLTIIRINPSPVITFHRAAFLGGRELSGCQFTTRLLDCMFFNAFVAERGPPWRVCDVWDELYSNMPEQLKAENLDPQLEMVHIEELAKQLHLNENPNPQGYQQRVLRPPEGVSARIHQPPLPRLDGKKIQAIIDEGLAKNNLSAKLSSMRPAQPRIVPAGPGPNPYMDPLSLVLPNSARRLEVLRNCVTCIFENKIADARKTFPAALRALRAPTARRALCAELAIHVLGNKAVLQHQQFDLVVKLMNCALQDDSAMDEQGVAAALLPLATAFCRKLCTGVIQFAYMCIQEHAVWQNQQFWEAAFYQDVQRDIKALYAPPSNIPPHPASSPRDSPEAPLADSLLRSQEPNALEIAAEQMRLWHTVDAEKALDLIKSEESTIYSQAIHFANRMVYLLVPLEAGRRQDAPRHHDDERASNSITNSAVESDSADAESGFEEADPGEAGANVIKMVSRFVDKVCTEGGVTSEHIRSLHSMVPGVVHMHMEILEAVSRESKRLPPIQKPRILTPCLVSGESVIVGGLRAFLVSDGREDGGAALLPLLPAEGALFLTNYRLIFKGAPCDPFACEQTVVRAFPLMTLTKEKPVRMQYMAHLDQLLQDGLQLRSSTFQLIKVAFDEEVSSEQTEQLRKAIGRLRHPPHVLKHFAFTGTRAAPTLVPLHPQGEKHATLKALAKKTLMKTARRAGFKQKSSGKRQKYVLPSPGARSLTAPPATPSDDLSLEELEASGAMAGSSLSRKAERGYVRDWQRLGLTSDPFRLSAVNANYVLCRSYPALMTVPATVSDDSVNKFVRCYRQNRVPILTWRHQRTGALLARSSASHHKGVIGMLKSSHPGSSQQSTTPGGAETSPSSEQIRYLCALLSAGRSTWRGGSGVGVGASGGVVGVNGAGGWAFSESSLSLDSLLLGGGNNDEPAATPDAARRHTNPLFSRAMGTLSVFPRGSGGKGGGGGSSVSVATSSRQLGRWGSLKDRRAGSQADIQHGGTLQRNSGADADSVCGDVGGGSRRPALYVLCEKGGWSGWAGMVRGCEAVPVEYPDTRASKHAFKKLLRACIPSQPVLGDPDASFYRLIEESGWLITIRSLMQLSGAVVDLLDAQGSSVCLSLEDGWDITAQVSSIAQVCLDPLYRTLDGFRTLIEKEWLAMGHRFPQRSNIGTQPQAGFTPTFLQFLDVVHQIQKQFPLAFEFNEYYVRFLAYHSVSCRFRTFLFEYEMQKEELGIAAAEDKRGSLNSRQRCVETGPGGSDDESVYPGGVGIPSGQQSGSGSGQRSAPLGQSVFDYIEKQNQRSPIFFNFLYTPDFEHPVLRPQSSIACLDVWDYYTMEELSSGAPYEPDALQQERCRREEREAAEGGASALETNRLLVTAGYDGVAASLPDAFTRVLERLRRLQLELGHLPQKWRVLWDKLELPTTDELARNASFSSAMVRSHGRAAHKRSTLDILMKARQAAQPQPGSSSNANNQLGSGGGSGTACVGASGGATMGQGGGSSPMAHPHRFASAHNTTFTYCDHCKQLLWGPVKTGVRCMDCGYLCHERCADAVPAHCTKYKVVSAGSGNCSNSGGGMAGEGGGGLLSSGTSVDQQSSMHHHHHHQDTPSVNSSVATLQTSSQQYYDQFSSNVAENKTHEGYLYKRGNLLKGWKQRWFVLDSIKHQLRYYDAVEDSHCKGHIDLAEVVSVAPALPAPGPPKKTDSKSFFDLRTSRRTFNFCAGTSIHSQEWIEKLQACLQ